GAPVDDHGWPGSPPGRAPRSGPGDVTGSASAHSWPRHVPGSWLAPPMHALYDRHLGPGWEQHSGEPEVWANIEEVEDGELGESHQILRSRLGDFVRRRVARQGDRRGESAAAVAEARQVLSEEALTIGFARRFASYKRADLLLGDRNRLVRLLENP